MACNLSPKMEEGWERNFSKKSWVGQKNLISKRGSVMGQANFLKGVQGIFGENRKLHKRSVMNQNQASKDSRCTKVN